MDLGLLSSVLAGQQLGGYNTQQPLGYTTTVTPEMQAQAQIGMAQMGIVPGQMANPYNSGTPVYSIGGQTFGGPNPQVQANPLSISDQIAQLQAMSGSQQPLATQPQGNFTPFGTVNKPYQMPGFSRFPDYQQHGWGSNQFNNNQWGNRPNQMQNQNDWNKRNQANIVGNTQINPNIINPVRPVLNQSVLNGINPYFIK